MCILWSHRNPSRNPGRKGGEIVREKIAEIIYYFSVLGQDLAFLDWGDVSKQEKEVLLNRTDQILDLPITKDFPCEECGGSGHAQCKKSHCENYYYDIGAGCANGDGGEPCPVEVKKRCPNPKCKGGQVEMTMVETGKCYEGMSQKSPACLDIQTCDEECKGIPLTHSTLPKSLENVTWRAM
jgi:hypothetical protein